MCTFWVGYGSMKIIYKNDNDLTKKCFWKRTIQKRGLSNIKGSNAPFLTKNSILRMFFFFKQSISSQTEPFMNYVYKESLCDKKNLIYTLEIKYCGQI